MSSLHSPEETPTSTAVTVSFDEEPLILVDPDDNVVGHQSKYLTHQGRGLLHRAFSIFLFDSLGRVMLHQRAADKPLWPGYWTNACCSHPRRGETLEQATARRLQEELGTVTELYYCYRFIYQAQFKNVGSEHELCAVYIGQLTEHSPPLAPNPTEIAAHGWYHLSEVDRWIDEDPGAFTPWFLIEWTRLRRDFQQKITALNV
ncbi:isopentenyl-diphosphate delta-isomerase [Luminiphilus syltensis NOR5-1B]|uniref:Isopentenyl-diphosphate Delta-isomerase n=1 Tax=Luminiphilus syltensis NOR5-1B TaxID=565045 RepID=B8KT29_9GAMM|nr:isopentenyl-diphosphate Delta-isomerase [Luminiphilus syltensis]EED36858.1 isopentenyl-diphosphate delta-isomerase [Luminiphilus syltensis NOR5-1B]